MSTSLHLTEFDRSLLAGDAGEGAAFAMRLVVSFAEAVAAAELLDITGAHVDGCLYHGEVSLDFVERLNGGGARVRVPTTLNVGSVDLIHPGLVRGPDRDRAAGRALMQSHLALGCEPSFTCAPYQTRFRPRFREQIAWGESNAIVFANSVIGARTNRYGDFIDLACAVTGRAPAYGLHLDRNRRGEVLFRLNHAGQEPFDSLFIAAGYVVGELSRGRVPVIEGLPPPRSEDQWKAFGAAAASSGSVALFHAVGLTPEAATLDEALGGLPAGERVEITADDLRRALAGLSSVPDGTPISAVCLGTPHFSFQEFQRLAQLLVGFRPAAGVTIYVNTARETLGRLESAGMVADLEAAGVTLVIDTCTYVTTVLRRLDAAVMTNSGKWAHYAPGNIGATVAFGELEDCIASAAEGCVVRTGTWLS